MLLPMFALVVLTFLVMLIMVTVRFRSVINRDVPGQYYRLMSGHDVPDYVAKPVRQFTNLFETPVLFYVAGTLFIVLDIQSTAAVSVAWLYVLLRIIHAVIHLTYNHVVHRLAVFALSACCILVLWVILILQA
jgi:hypothetical protein